MPRPNLSRLGCTSLASLALLAVVYGCVVFEDRCLGHACDDGEICLDLSEGPTCVCDDVHEEIDGVCVAVDDEGDGGASG